MLSSTRSESRRRHSIRDRDGLRRPDRVRVRVVFRRGGLRRHRDRKRPASYFFGATHRRARTEAYSSGIRVFRSLPIDIRDFDAVSRLFAEHRHDLELGDPYRGSAVPRLGRREPLTDSRSTRPEPPICSKRRVNTPEATFIFTSTNKVYGDRPNNLPLRELETRRELPADHEYYDGIPTTMRIDSPALAVRRVEGRG